MKERREAVTEAKHVFEEMQRDEEGLLLGSINNYYSPDAPQKVLQTIVGLPGAGKSVLLRMVVKKLRESTIYNRIFICNIDISDCADEIAVYFKMARELRLYYEQFPWDAPDRSKQQIKALNQFFQIYEWLYGKAGEYPDNTSQAETLAGGIQKAVGMLQKNMASYLEGYEEDIDSNTYRDKLTLACDLIGGIVDVVPYVNSLRMLVDLAVNNVREKKVKKLLQDVLTAFESKSEREEIFRNLILLSMPESRNGENNNPIIILDNFQLLQNNQLGRDHTWLSKPGRIMSKLNAMWIIAGRSSVIEQFRNIFREEGIYPEISLSGFTENQARTYLEGRCNQILTGRGIDRQVDVDVVNKMLQVCHMEEHQHIPGDGEHAAVTIYLPYLLNLVVLHYKKLAEDVTHVITPDQFASLRSEEEFVGYYFYQDLSDLMTNAFQILCCLPTWDDKWIEIVRKQFDNHLLNAPNLLFKTAPMERLGGDRFKLHEAIKDGLYNNSRNYIKHDVLKYLYLEFIRTYGGEEARNNRDLWYEPQRLDVFLEIVYEYIDQRTDKQACINEVKSIVEKIYGDNEGRGTVTDSFIQIYSKYIDQLRKIYGIPFIDLAQRDFSDDGLGIATENVERIFQNPDVDFPNIDHTVYYMQCCFSLADLYTNINLSGEARNLEKLCLKFWDCMGQLTDERAVGEEAYWHCRRNRIKALNSIAYDSSQEQEYSIAYKYGTDGLSLLDESIREMSELFDVPEEISLIMFPEEENNISVNNCTEISGEVYEKLKKGYAVLHGWAVWKPEDKKSSEMTKDDNAQDLEDIQRKKILQKIFATMLLIEQQNLRGNYPWYCLKTEEGNLQGQSCWEYGARTYWMRKACLEAANESVSEAVKKMAKDFKYQGKMLISYHNVCVYLYKNGRVETACVLEREVLELSRRILNRHHPDSTMQYRMDELQKHQEDGNGFWEYMWRTVIGKNGVMGLLLDHNNILEQIQYLGDYYLHMDFYAIALKHLSHVALSRYVRFGEKDNRTMDSLLRLYVAAFANNNEECIGKFNTYAKETLLPQSVREPLKDKARALVSKINCLERLIQMSADRNEERQGILQKMLEDVDKADKKDKADIV